MSTLYVDNLEPNLGSQVEIPDLKPLAGSVVQVVQTYDPGSPNVVGASGALIPSGIQASITPKKAGNLILVSFSVSMVHQNGSGYIKGRMFVNGSHMGNDGQYQLGYQNSSSPYHPFVFNGQYTTAGTNALLFEPYYQGDGASMRLVHADASYALTLMEIAQ